MTFDCRLPLCHACRWLLAVGGCYLMQAASGQMEIASKRAADRQSAGRSRARRRQLRTRLEYVSAARDFASQRARPAGQRQLSQLRRSRPPLRRVERVRDRRVLGRAAPLVFSDRGLRRVSRLLQRSKRAEAMRARLRLRGDDAAVGGVAAYSTLGHFKDPVLNTMLGWSDAQLAGDAVPRAGASGRLRAGRFGVQRSVRDGGRGGRPQRWLARAAATAGLDAWQ